MTPYTNEERESAAKVLESKGPYWRAESYLSCAKDSREFGDSRAWLAELSIDLQCALTRAEVELERLRKRESEARRVVEVLTASAVPNPRDHPTMTKAWTLANQWLSETATEPEGQP